jgi:diacylglycerol kinase family enzyme
VALLRHRPSSIRYSIDGGPIAEGALNLIVVANGPYAGGGMRIAPSASMEDGLLDVVTMRGASRNQMLFRLLPAVYRGTHLGHPAVDYSQAHQIRIESDAALSVQMDGEIVGTTPVRIDLLPRALPVWLSPPGA